MAAKLDVVLKRLHYMGAPKAGNISIERGIGTNHIAFVFSKINGLLFLMFFLKAIILSSSEESPMNQQSSDPLYFVNF